MSSQRLKPIAAAIVLGGLTTTTVSALALAADLHQQAAATPHQSASEGEETAASAAGAKVLRLIAKARDDIHQDKGDAAAKELHAATAMLARAKGALPRAVIKGQIAAGKKQLEQQGTTDLVPIATSLDELGGSVSTAEAKAHLDRAGRDLEQGNPEGAIAELDAIDAALTYAEVDLPLGATEHLIDLAEAKLAAGDPAAADEALAAAQHEVVYLTVAVNQPLVSARSSLWRAAQDHAARASASEKADLDQAIQDLERAAQDADQKTREAIDRLRQQVVALRNSVGDSAASSRLEEFWRRADALAQRSVEYFTVGWEQLFTDSAKKKDLIDAKLHLAYAAIDRFTAQRPDQAERELGQAEHDLTRAWARARGEERAAINQVREQVAALRSAEAPPKSDFADTTTALRHLIQSV